MTTAGLHPENNEVAREQLVARGWAALPASYRMPANPPSLAEARAGCKQLAESHYENFHVASWFLPEALRPHFHAIYAYCRISDDLGDEVGDTAQSLALLDFWGNELDACYEGRARHPIAEHRQRGADPEPAKILQRKDGAIVGQHGILSGF